MAIKNDRWIRRLAEEEGMIEPFEARQVRGDCISYGLSSYGYDIRVAPEFKVFTNVHNVVVDPKEFDERSFVDVKADTCIIPPNSFALARTEEYFRIPRDVLAICVGKSTYARCFRGDTRVALVDGTAPTLEEMARRSEDGEMFWGYSIGRYGRVIVSLLDAPRHVGRDSLMELTLDNGRTLHCTPDHGFVRRDGRRCQAHELRPGDSLMPLYRSLVRGYESVYQPLNGHLYPTHRLADEWNLRNGIYPDAPGTHRHHRDHDRRNNVPWNIERMEAGEHIRLHNAESFQRVQRERAVGFWNEKKYAGARERLRKKQVLAWTQERRADRSQRMSEYYSNSADRKWQSEKMKRAWTRAGDARRNQQREIARNLRLRSEITRESVRTALDRTGSIRGAARLLECDRSVFRRFPEVIAEFPGNSAVRNHKVTRVRELPGDHDVYCLTVPEAGNFALDAGVFVRNCGIVVNVTPLEPSWCGYLTLEISNTTPLPAKIYAGEGIAQLLFLQGDELPEVAYADRKGKYQGQEGVTLPKM